MKSEPSSCQPSRATKRHLPYGITRCYPPLSTDEHFFLTPAREVLDLPMLRRNGRFEFICVVDCVVYVFTLRPLGLAALAAGNCLTNVQTHTYCTFSATIGLFDKAKYFSANYCGNLSSQCKITFSFVPLALTLGPCWGTAVRPPT